MKLTLMVGLPGSGKSTKAKEIIKASGNTVRINADLLRTMLHFDTFSGPNEGITNDVMNMVARGLLKNNINVIIDNCNLSERHRQRWSGIAQECGAKFEIVDLTNVSVDECIMRDSKRPNPVGRHLIIMMAMQYKLLVLDKVIICDLDGTLCDATWRQHHVRKDPKDWDAFYAGIPEDEPRMEVLDLIRSYKVGGHNIVFMSGRPETYRIQSECWLYKYWITNPILLMRKAHDRRPDYIVKKELMETYLIKENIVVAIEDRPSIIRMYRENGIPVIDVGNQIEF